MLINSRNKQTSIHVRWWDRQNQKLCFFICWREQVKIQHRFLVLRVPPTPILILNVVQIIYMVHIKHIFTKTNEWDYILSLHIFWLQTFTSKKERKKEKKNIASWHHFFEKSNTRHKLLFLWPKRITVWNIESCYCLRGTYNGRNRRYDCFIFYGVQRFWLLFNLFHKGCYSVILYILNKCVTRDSLKSSNIRL